MKPLWLVSARMLAAILATLLVACAPISAGVAIQPVSSTSQPAAPNEAKGWASYTHPEWGITVHYPSAWTLSVPDFDKLATPPAEGVPEGYTYNPNIEQMRMLGHAITLYIPGADGSPASEVNIALDTFTLSPGAALQTWVDLNNQLNATENPLADETTITPIDAADLPFAKAGDQVVYQVIENRLLHNETIWIAKGELVFLIMSSSADPQVQQQFFQVASSLEFDPDKLAAIRARAPFAGDEQQIKETVAHLQPQPTPSIGAVHTAGLQSYIGTNPYGQEYPQYVIYYDPAIWQLVPDAATPDDKLVNTTVPSCTVQLNRGAMEAPILLEKQVGPYKWYVGETNNPRAFLYWTQVSDTLYLILGLEVPDVEATERNQQCTSMAEEIFGAAAFVTD